MSDKCHENCVGKQMSVKLIKDARIEVLDRFVETFKDMQRQLESPVTNYDLGFNAGYDKAVRQIDLFSNKIKSEI